MVRDELRRKVRERIDRATERRRRRQDPRPVLEEDPTGLVAYRQLPPQAGALRNVAVECPECHSLVLNDSVTAHAADHVYLLLLLDRAEPGSPSWETQPSDTLNGGNGA